MSGFGEHFKNERREKTLKFFKNLFDVNKKTKYFYVFWIFFILTICAFYHTLTYDKKYTKKCGEIVNFETNYKTQEYNDGTIDTTYMYHFFINNEHIIYDVKVDYLIYKTYEKLQNSGKKLEYCDEYTNNIFIFYIILTIILSILTIIYLITYNSTYN